MWRPTTITEIEIIIFIVAPSVPFIRSRAGKHYIQNNQKPSRHSLPVIPPATDRDTSTT